MPMLTELPQPRYQINLVETEDDRYYKVNWHEDGIDWERRLPGVTSTLKIIGGEKTQALMGWHTKEAMARAEANLLEALAKKKLTPVSIASILQEAKKQPKRSLEQAGEEGTEIHGIIDHVIKAKPGEIVEYPPEWAAQVEGMFDWARRQQIRFIAGDTPVACLAHGFAGSLDSLWWAGGRLVLGDWKSSKAIREETPLQIGAYYQALKETYGVTADEGWVVRIKKKPAKKFIHHPFEPEVRVVRDLDHAFRSFLVAKDLEQRMSKSHFMEKTNG